MASQSYLIEDPKYSFLKELGLQKENSGVYNGKWVSDGSKVRMLSFFKNAFRFAPGTFF